VKKILKRREKHGEEGSPDYVNRVKYEVHTIRYDRDGSKASERLEKLDSKPKEFKDIHNSLKMIEKFKRDSMKE
jgi:hypothetical protein